MKGLQPTDSWKSIIRSHWSLMLDGLAPMLHIQPSTRGRDSQRLQLPSQNAK